MAEREYKDSEGNVVTLDKLVRIEPEWAANIIRWYEGKLDEYEHRAKLHMDRCQHDMERIVRLEQQLAEEDLDALLEAKDTAGEHKRWQCCHCGRIRDETTFRRLNG